MASMRIKWVSVAPEPATLVFDDCRIPAENLLGKEGEGFKIAMQTLDVSRTFIGCMAVGIAQRAMEEAIAYGKERIQFGKPIVSNQAIAFKLADMGNSD